MALRKTRLRAFAHYSKATKTRGAKPSVAIRLGEAGSREIAAFAQCRPERYFSASTISTGDGLHSPREEWLGKRMRVLRMPSTPTTERAVLLLKTVRAVAWRVPPLSGFRRLASS